MSVINKILLIAYILWPVCSSSMFSKKQLRITKAAPVIFFIYFFGEAAAAAFNSFRTETVRNVLPPSARIVMCGSWKRGRVGKSQQVVL